MTEFKTPSFLESAGPFGPFPVEGGSLTGRGCVNRRRIHNNQRDVDNHPCRGSGPAFGSTPGPAARAGRKPARGIGGPVSGDLAQESPGPAKRRPAGPGTGDFHAAGFGFDRHPRRLRGKLVLPHPECADRLHPGTGEPAAERTLHRHPGVALRRSPFSFPAADDSSPVAPIPRSALLLPVPPILQED